MRTYTLDPEQTMDDVLGRGREEAGVSPAYVEKRKLDTNAVKPLEKYPRARSTVSGEEMLVCARPGGHL